MMKAANQPLRKVAAVEPAFQAQWTYSTCSSVVVSVVAGKLSFIRSISFTLAPIDVRIHTIFNYELLLKFIAIENILLIKKPTHFFHCTFRRRERRGKDLVHQLGVTLEELYNGAVRKLALQKSIICDKCEGRGGKKGAVEKCQTCRGNGIEVKIHMIGPGMAQQIEQVCSHCHGQGEIIAAKDRCKTCNGKKTVRDRKILEVHIEKGMRDGQKIVFSGEGDQEPDLQPGDIVIVLEEIEHALFKRSKQDLVMTMPLQLVESLCGFQKVIKTLDNRDLVVTNLPGEVVKHDSFKSILGEGMPQYKNPFEKGRLIIQFQIVFPEKIPQIIVADLEKCLPPRPRVDIPIDAEECNMVSE